MISKGCWYYEMQILMFVFMWKHDLTHNPENKHIRGIRIGRFYIRYDSGWLYHGVGLTLIELIQDFFNSIQGLKIVIFYHTIMIKIYDIKIRFMHIKLAYLKWQLSILMFIGSLSAYLRLYKAGFRITEMTDPDYHGNYSRFRFFWKDKMIRDMADIGRYKDHYNTIFNGHVESLNEKP